MPTLEEIAQISNVSRSTVSRVINGDPHVSDATREKVMAVVQQLNYRPNLVARSLAAGKTHILGLVIPAGISSTFRDPFFYTFIQSMASVCNADDYSVMLWLADPDYERRMISQILRNGFLDGLIVSAMHITDEILKALQATDLPFILIGQDPSHAKVSYVEVENQLGAREIVSHLLRLGYQRIATITGPMDTVTAMDRKQGYIDALHARAKVVEPGLIVEGDFTEASGYYGMQRLLSHKPDAVFSANDMMALGALRAIREAGLSVPRDIGLAGFDDIPAASQSVPPLTTVRQPSERMGIVATELLIDMIEHPGTEQHRVVLPTELVIRSSCGATSLR